MASRVCCAQAPRGPVTMAERQRLLAASMWEHRGRRHAPGQRRPGVLQSQTKPPYSLQYQLKFFQILKSQESCLTEYSKWLMQKLKLSCFFSLVLKTSQKREMVKLNGSLPVSLSQLVHSEKSLPRSHKAGLYYFCMIFFLMYLL